MLEILKGSYNCQQFLVMSCVLCFWIGETFRKATNWMPVSLIIPLRKQSSPSELGRAGFKNERFPIGRMKEEDFIKKEVLELLICILLFLVPDPFHVFLKEVVKGSCNS